MRDLTTTSMLWQSFAAICMVQVLAVVAVRWLHARTGLLKRYLGHAVALAVGVLLATGLLHLLPEAIEQLGNRRLLWIAFSATFVFLFAIERIFSALTGNAAETAATENLTTHTHHHGHHTTRPLNLVFGGMLHSFVDGVSAAAAFALGPRIGVLTAVAIVLHEVPHRLGDFALFMHLGLPEKKALRLAAMVGAPSLLGVFLVAAIGNAGVSASAWLLPVSAASFVYVAAANLMPELQHECKLIRVAGQIAAMIAGAALVVLLGKLPGA